MAQGPRARRKAILLRIACRGPEFSCSAGRHIRIGHRPCHGRTASTTDIPRPVEVRGWPLAAGRLDCEADDSGIPHGLWYWVSARKYAQTKMDWNAWFYYRLATDLLDPLDFLSSPNLEKLQHEADQIRPTDLPGKAAMTFYAQSELIRVTAIDTSTELGGLDLDVHYAPDATQAVQLRDPISARRQVTAAMSALLKMHPEMQGAFHGIWVHADQGTGTLFALELPMDQIAAALVCLSALRGWSRAKVTH